MKGTKGTVKWFNKDRGYGFLIGEDNKEYFVHHSQIRMEGFRALDEGDIVYFKVGETDKNKRIQAVNVEPVITSALVDKALTSEGLYLRYTKDLYGNRVWIVVDTNNVSQSDEQGMNLEEVAAFAGINVNEE